MVTKGDIVNIQAFGHVKMAMFNEKEVYTGIDIV